MAFDSTSAYIVRPVKAPKRIITGINHSFGGIKNLISLFISTKILYKDFRITLSPTIFILQILGIF